MEVIEELAWCPQYGQVFWFVNDDLEVESTICNNSENVKEIISTKPIFHKKDLAINYYLCKGERNKSDKKEFF